MGYGYRGSRAGVENWNTQLRKENQKLKERLDLEIKFEKFLKDNDLECLIMFDRFKWEVKVFREWMNESWSIVKCHEDKFSAISMAFAEAKIKVPQNYDSFNFKF